ncbi:hypothetical protein MKW92_041114 [Papaver armeniacum]|nr:hypothetical protein MKW92_041114 [Papaver armeniacum]
MVSQRHFIVTVSYWLILASCASAFGGVKPGCQAKCGNISIPYPFGISTAGEEDNRGAGGCSIHGVGKGYNINCNTSFDPPKAFLYTSNDEILSISETQIRTKSLVSSLCYNKDGGLVLNETIVFSNHLETPFTFSNTSNRLFVIGCNTGGVTIGYDLLDKHYSSQCFSICNSREDVREGSCNGNGCCQSTIQHGLKLISTGVIRNENITNTTTLLSFDPCSYAFVAEHEQFTFQASDLLSVTKAVDIPVVLDWVIGNKTCEEAKKDPTTFACQQNSHCNNSGNNPGYRCTCFAGYKGNPYLSPGCQAGSHVQLEAMATGGKTDEVAPEMLSRENNFR